MRTKKSKKFLKGRRNKKISSYLLLSLGLLIVLVLGFALVSRMEYFEVNSIQVTGDKKSIHKNILAIIEKEVDGFYFGIFSKRSAFFLPKEKIKASIYNSFDEIKKVDLDFDGLNYLDFTIETRKPFAVWCFDTLASSEECFFLDEQGFIYSQAPSFSGDVFFKYYGGVNGLKAIGSSFLNEEEFKKVSFFLKTLEKELLINPISFSLEKDEYKINMKDEKNSRGFWGGEIIFNKTDDLSLIFEKIKTILENDLITEGFEDKEIILDYIDLRFGNKVFYKFK